MSFFPLNLMQAIATGAAIETGRGIARRNGLGFTQGDSGAEDYGGDYFFDDFGNYWEYDWFNTGGGDYYGGGLPYYDTPDWTGFGPAPSPSGNDYRYDFDWGQYLSDWLSGNVESINTFAQAPGQQPSYRDITGNLDYQNSLWDWLTNLGPGPAPLDPQYGPAGTGQGLPKPCYGPTYHPYPIGHPQQDLCVPYPENAPSAKKQVNAEKKAQQAALSAAKKAQQAADRACPKDPQGRPVWHNPTTNKCELVPPCTTPGTKFDSTTKRCLTAAQAKELYGDNNWLLWLLIAAGALVIINSGGGSGGGRRR